MIRFNIGTYRFALYWKAIAGRCIYQGEHDVRVYQNAVYRWLRFESLALQTLIHRRHPERIALPYIHALTWAAYAFPGPSCLLGLGGAGVAHALMPVLGEHGLTAVEHHAEVIEVASSFFMRERLDKLTVIHQDAQLFVEQTQPRYQHLMVDLFDAHAFPTHCNTVEFFESCRQLLLPGGVLAVNVANLSEQWPIVQFIRDCFPQKTICIPIKGTANLVVLAYHDTSLGPLLDIMQRDKRLKRLEWHEVWGCVALFKGTLAGGIPGDIRPRSRFLF